MFKRQLRRFKELALEIWNLIDTEKLLGKE